MANYIKTTEEEVSFLTEEEVVKLARVELIEDLKINEDEELAPDYPKEINDLDTALWYLKKWFSGSYTIVQGEPSRFEFLECTTQAEIDKAVKNHNLEEIESDNYEVGRSTLILEDEYGEIQVHFVLSGATTHSPIWRCIFVLAKYSTSRKTES